MKHSKFPTKTELEEIFEVRGEELWRKSFRGKPKIVANKKNHSDGYCIVRVKGRLVLYHTIIWVLNNGNIPEDLIIDHINGDKIDNRIENLRLVSNRENLNNTHKHRNGRLPGCCFHKRDKKWKAQINLNKSSNSISLGYYLTEQEAHEMYIFVLNNINKLNTKNEVQNYARTHPNCTLRRSVI